MSTLLIHSCVVGLLSIALICLGLGVLSLLENRRFTRRRILESCPHLASPPMVSVIVPCFEVSLGIRENLVSYLRQDYPNVELIFVVPQRQGRIAQLITSLIEENRFLKLKMVVDDRMGVAPSHVTSALLTGIDAAHDRSQIFAFGDATARVDGSWLRWMVYRLRDPAVGVVTGSLWHLPRHQTMPNRLSAIFQNSYAAFQGPGYQLFFSRGTWALTQQTFRRCDLRSIWERVIDERWSTVTAIRTAKLKIAYEPQCRAVSTIDTNKRSVWRAMRREAVFESVYAPMLWLAGIAVLTVVQAAYWGSLAMTIAEAIRWDALALWYAAANTLVFGLSGYRVYLKNQLGKLNVSEWRQMKATRNLDLMAWPLVELLILINKLSAVTPKTVLWSGYRYQLSSSGNGRLLGVRHRHDGLDTSADQTDTHSRAA